MGRAAGKKGPGRDPVSQAIEDLKQLAGFGSDDDGSDPGVRRQEGIGEPRDIPGGLNHLANPPVQQQAVPRPEPEWRFRQSMLAHGVPPDEAGRHDRDPRLSGGQRGQAAAEKIAPRVSPVPVYIVESEGGPSSIRRAFPRSVTCPASTSAEPIRVAGRNPDRVKISLLNEDTATDIRFATNLTALSAGTGALLPWPGNSYLTLETQDEIYAIGATGSGTPKLSIVEVFAADAADAR
jgi:hypothetical protein